MDGRYDNTFRRYMGILICSPALEVQEFDDVLKEGHNKLNHGKRDHDWDDRYDKCEEVRHEQYNRVDQRAERFREIECRHFAFHLLLQSLADSQR
jgi:hypothetical protein